MAYGVTFKPARGSSSDIAAAPRANGLPASTPARRRGAAARPLRPSQVPVQSTATPARMVTEVLRGSGESLGAPVREEMTSLLNADFSSVRVHTGTAARASAAAIGARAYTFGDHVVIGDGGADKHTLTHELVHVIQQRQGLVTGTDVGNGLKVSDPADRFEQEAAASAAGSGSRLQDVAGNRAAERLTSGPITVQRIPEKNTNTKDEFDYFDRNYPGLTMKSLGRDVSYGVDLFQTRSGTTLYYLEGRYYTDRGATVMADMNSYSSSSASDKTEMSDTESDEEESHPTTYKYVDPGNKAMILWINDFARNLVNPREKLDAGRLKTTMAEMRAGIPVYPLQAQRVKGGKYKLVNGNHRLFAAQQSGYSGIPVIFT
jgi:hypothetical protein